MLRLHRVLAVLTPSFNQLPFLRQCVASLAAQEHPVEHVIMDGASQDGTVEFLATQSIPHRSARDGGMYEALNAGVPLTRAPWLGWLNCDDLLLPWASRLVEDIAAQHPGVDLIVGDSVELRDQRLALTIHPPAALVRPFLRRGGFLAQPSVFFSRRLWERLGGFNTHYRLLADHDFWLRALLSGARVARVWEVLSVQRMVPGQLMEKHAAAAAQERMEIERSLALRRSRASSLASAVLHRAGILGALLPGTAALPAHAWELARSSGLWRLQSRGALFHALTASTATTTYMEPGPHAQALLFPDGDA